MLAEDRNSNNGKQVISKHTVPVPRPAGSTGSLQTCHTQASSLHSLTPPELCLPQVAAEVTSSWSLLSQLLNGAKWVVKQNKNPSIREQSHSWVSVSLREGRSLSVPEEKKPQQLPGPHLPLLMAINVEECVWLSSALGFNRIPDQLGSLLSSSKIPYLLFWTPIRAANSWGALVEPGRILLLF